MKKILLSGKNPDKLYALVDDEDYAMVSRFKWFRLVRKGSRNIYATTTISRKLNDSRPGNHRNVTMHRSILWSPKGYDIDHINMNGLDNRRSNLRIATRSQNCSNSRKYNNNASGFRGVFRKDGEWYAAISIGGRAKCIGYFSNKIDAARAYDKRAKELRGEFAKLNFPRSEPKPKKEKPPISEEAYIRRHIRKCRTKRRERFNKNHDIVGYYTLKYSRLKCAKRDWKRYQSLRKKNGE